MRRAWIMIIVVLLGTPAAAAADTPGSVFDAQTAAFAVGNYPAACALLAPSVLQPLQVLGWDPAQVQARCAQQLKAEVDDLDPARRAALVVQRAVATRLNKNRALVTVEYPLFGLTVRATGRAQRLDGRWLISAAPGRDHVGRQRVLRVPAASMIPTLRVGDTILVDQDAYLRRTPALGDLVVLHPPPGSESRKACGVQRARGEACRRARPGEVDDLYVKRVVAGPGDRFSIRRGRVVRNGLALPEPFIKGCGPLGHNCTLPRTITVPAKRWYVLGDNRGESSDSRDWGPVAASAFVGRARRVGP